MNKLILALTSVALIFVAGNAFGATIQCHMDNDQPGLFYAPLPGVFDFQITIDDNTGDILNFKGLFPYMLNEESNGGWNTDDGAPFALNEQVFKTSNTYDLSTIYFDDYGIQESGHGLWWRTPDMVDGFMWSVGICNSSYDSDTRTGQFMLGPALSVAESYVFSSVPIPSAIWLLGSAFIGIIGFRRKFGKEVG